MGRIKTFAARSRGTTYYHHGRLDGKYLLPISEAPESRRFRFYALLGHCLYRRVLLWLATVFIFFSVVLLYDIMTHRRSSVLYHDHFRIHQEEKLLLGDEVASEKELQAQKEPKPLTLPQGLHGPIGGEITMQTIESTAEMPLEVVETQSQSQQSGSGSIGPNWLQYPHLNGYFSGVRSIVPFQNHTPEYPRPDFVEPITTTPIHHMEPPEQKLYKPYPDYASAEYKAKHIPVNECFLDPDRNIPAPSMYAFAGVPQYQPDPVFGSHALLGLRDDVCFDRWGRYGAYGLGYDMEQGGIGEGMDTEGQNTETLWAKTGKIDYRNVDWGMAQTACVQNNERRFKHHRHFSERSKNRKANHRVEPDSSQIKMERIAVVVRMYVGFEWTPHTVLNFRAMIAELNLQSGGEYDVHLLVHVKDDERPIWADEAVAQAVLDAHVPREFHGLCTLWSEAEMRLHYPGRYDDAAENPSGQALHGVYRSAHFPLQVFAARHPEYAHFWNWEMDMRYLGNYYELLDRLGSWAKSQPRDHLWERSAKYYMPSVHGSWENFTETVRRETAAAGRSPVFGPVVFPGRGALRGEEHGLPVMPSNCVIGLAGTEDSARCGVGEDADLVTLSPLFDPADSGWVFAKDVTGYPAVWPLPPRRTAIVTASRLSRRLLAAMHEETWRLRHAMFAEMFPASMALHHGFKAVYAPHPTYIDRAWPSDALEASFNAGADGSTGGERSPFGWGREHVHGGTTWYYNAEFAGLLWRRWLGYAQLDGRGPGGGRGGAGTWRGGAREEMDERSSGRLCLRSMLLHPIKWERSDE